MSKILNRDYSFLAPVVVSATVAASSLIISASANAEAQASSGKVDSNVNTSDVIRSINSDILVNNLQLTPNAVAQNVTSVSQLSDVRSNDWAFIALQSLVERYQCIAGYPDRTFRGKQATSRYEFAAGLNACLDKINEIISAGLADKVSKEDLATLQKLQEEFAAELATLRGRVDALDAKVAKLEAQQFSTTTKLRGEAIFGLAAASDGIVGNNGTLLPNGGTDRTNTIFSYRVRLNLDTSFTGKDLLRTRLQASNTPNIAGTISGTAAAPVINGLGVPSSSRLSFDSESTPNTFEINRLSYKFPIGDNFTAYIAPIGQIEDILNPLNPLESDSQATISRFGRFSPLIRIASAGGATGLAVAGFDWKISDKVNFQAAYSASNAAATGSGGVTGGDTKIAAQFVLKPADNLTFGIGYANAYTIGEGLNSGLNADSVPLGPIAPGLAATGFKSNTVVGSVIWDITKQFTFNAWGSWTFIDGIVGSTGATAVSTTNTSWLASLSGKDLFSEGDLAAISFGQPLFTTSASSGAIALPAGFVGLTSPNTPYQLEAFYRIPVSKNITITPGVFFVFNQGSDARNGTATVGVIRTTFTF
ncbi:iron uptake porin [Pseudanabaena sp. ABRG5-3]|uniref:iron uptake porin n=1 Tax=Pseudanabaena sp. ABRG5-3 TaxID=685565 RepID=UPI000DC6F5F7|nr:iron uptake porin [Pseudanabaena sp. ABRG5-3]BBC23328.1 carbohydrate-selective porin [Pseudanabaena sp. ABRG5-3]